MLRCGVVSCRVVSQGAAEAFKQRLERLLDGSKEASKQRTELAEVRGGCGWRGGKMVCGVCEMVCCVAVWCDGWRQLEMEQLVGSDAEGAVEALKQRL